MSIVNVSLHTMLQADQPFFDVCETGKGWVAGKKFCHPNATFSAQAGPLADIDRAEGYTEWIEGLVAIMPDAGYDLKLFALDEE